jgi:uroporphyrinogen-III synthase
MRLLVTRPEPEALKLRAALEDMDCEATVEPLLRVSFDDPDEIELSEAEALIATSRNAIRAIKMQPGLLAIARGLPLYAVGRATAIEARNAGFGLIVTGAGTGRDLVPQIISTLDPANGFLVHLAGEKLAYDLAGELEAHGFRVLQPIVYRTEPLAAFSNDTIEQLATGEIDGVILMSPQTAAIYVALIKRHDLVAAARKLVHFCLSPAVAARLKPLGDLSLEVATEPKLEDILALIVETQAKSEL